MAEEEDKQDEKFDFTSEGESLGYISLEQARLLAMQTARDDPGNYGARFADVPMVFDLVQQEDEEDYYIVTLSLRPAGDFAGVAGQEQFFIEKEGTVAYRQVLSLPRTQSRRLPLVPIIIGLATVAAATVGLLIAMGVFKADIESAILPETIIRPTATLPPDSTLAIVAAVDPEPNNTPSPTRTPAAQVKLGDTPTPSESNSPSTPVADVPTPMPSILSSGRIVFSSSRSGNDEIYLAEADGSSLTLLTNHPAADTQPSWSSDGRKIIVASDRTGSRDVFVMNADGTGLVNLTTNQAQDYDPAWSPDGTRVAFSSHRDGGFEVFVMNSDGSDTLRLTDNSGMENEGPAWSPDGSKIAFTSQQGNLDVFVMNAYGSGETRLTTHPGDDAGPAWSPDGSRVAYHSFRHSTAEIYLINADGTGETRLTDDNAANLNPSCSGDGTKIVFESDRDGIRELYTINHDGTGLARFTNGGGSSPAWTNTRASVAVAIPAVATPIPPAMRPTPTSVPTQTPTPRPTSPPSPASISSETTVEGIPITARDLNEFCFNVSLQIDSWDLPPTLPPEPFTGIVAIRYRIPLGAQSQTLFFSVDTSVRAKGSAILVKYPDASVEPTVNYLNGLNPYEFVPLTADGLWHVRSITIEIPSESQFMVEGQPEGLSFNWAEFVQPPYVIIPPTDYSANFNVNGQVIQARANGECHKTG